MNINSKMKTNSLVCPASPPQMCLCQPLQLQLGAPHLPFTRQTACRPLSAYPTPPLSALHSLAVIPSQCGSHICPCSTYHPCMTIPHTSSEKAQGTPHSPTSSVSYTLPSMSAVSPLGLASECPTLYKYWLEKKYSGTSLTFVHPGWAPKNLASLPRPTRYRVSSPNAILKPPGKYRLLPRLTASRLA